jgi:two-component system NtrC family response regulator
MALHFLERISADYRVPVRRLSADALAAMDAYQWPGNVRELENRIKRAVIMAQGRRITAADLELPTEVMPASLVSLKEARNEVARRVLVEALGRYRGNISRVAKAIQISRPALYELMIKHGIRAEDFKSEKKPGS